MHLEEGRIVWVHNPYPLNDTTHWTRALPNSARPEWVPARVKTVAEGGHSATVETLWEPVQVHARSCCLALPFCVRALRELVLTPPAS